MSSYAKPKPKVQGTINPIQPKLWFTLIKSSYHNPIPWKNEGEREGNKKGKKII